MSTQLWTAEDVAARWQVSTDLVYALTRAGELPVVNLGRRRRYQPAAIEAFEAAGGAALGTHATIGACT
jgi:excisionase family DNA binding protein